ncbi:MAG: CHRD domain-containing protein [Candidatus Limnocylindria bacterium]
MGSRARRSFGLAVLLGLIAAIGGAGATLAAEATLTAELAGVTEGDIPGDADGSGSATVVLDPEAGSVCWELSSENITPVLQSHIHVGADGESGRVVVALNIRGFESSHNGCRDNQDAAVLQAIVDDPDGHYVNLHTEDYPAGAIRGQLGGSDAAIPDTAASPSVRRHAGPGALLLLVASLTAIRTLSLHTPRSPAPADWTPSILRPTRRRCLRVRP